MANRVRDYEPADRDFILNLARRLGGDIASWRDRDAVDAAIRRSVIGVLDGEPRGDGATFVLDDDGSILGFVTIRLHQHFSGAMQASIEDLVVDEAVEGQGFAAVLIGAAESWARSAGAHAIVVETGASNERALRAYRRVGFLDEDTRLGKPLRP